MNESNTYTCLIWLRQMWLKSRALMHMYALVMPRRAPRRVILDQNFRALIF
jgi:hypothetical protein